MAKNVQDHEWHIGEESYSDAFASSAQGDHATAGHWQMGRTLLTGLGALMLLLLVGYRLMNQPPTNIVDGAAEIPVNADAIETSAPETKLVWQPPVDGSTLESGQRVALREDDPFDGWPIGVIADAASAEQVQNTELQGPWAIETVLILPPADDALWRFGPYRIRRFYFQDGDAWRPVSPMDMLVDTPQTLETQHLHFTFQPVDATSVRAIATEVDNAYLTLHQLLALTLPPEEEKPTFAIVLEDVTGLLSVGNRQRITSPIAARIPEAYSDSDYLIQQVTEHMAYMAVRAAISGAEPAYTHRWERITWALVGWLQKEVTGQRAPWHQKAADYFDPARFGGRPLSLVELFDVELNEWPSEEDRMDTYMLAESVVSFIVKEYGEGKLPLLIEGFGQFHTWDKLIPQLLDIPADEFEEGWNEYIYSQS